MEHGKNWADIKIALWTQFPLDVLPRNDEGGTSGNEDFK